MFNKPTSVPNAIIGQVTICSPQGYNEEYDPENVTSLPLSIFWTEPAPGRASDVMLSSKKLKDFKADLKKLDLKFTIQVSKLKYLKRPEAVFLVVCDPSKDEL